MVRVGQEEMIPGSPMVVDDDDDDDQQAGPNSNQGHNNNNSNSNSSSNKRNPPLLPSQQQENDTPRNNTTSSSSSSSKKRKKRADDKMSGNNNNTITSSLSPSRSSNKTRRGGGGALSSSGITATSPFATATSAPVLEYQDFCELPLTLKTVLLDEVEKITRRDSVSFVHHHAHFCSNINNNGTSNNSNNNNSMMQQQQQQQPPPRRPPARLVHDLPATVTIQQVLKHFCKKQQKANKQLQQQQQASTAANAATPSSSTQPAPPPLAAHAATDEQIQNFCQGLTNLFQEALPTVLLYPQERPQYEAIVKRFCSNDNTKNSSKQQQWTEIYGCEYLLRLYVRLPLLMQNPNNIHRSTVGTTTTTESAAEHSGVSGGGMAADDIRIVGPLLTQLLVLLQKNRQACFKGSSSFREPKPEEWTKNEKRIMYGDDDYSNDNHDATAADTADTTATVRDQHCSMDTV